MRSRPAAHCASAHTRVAVRHKSCGFVCRATAARSVLCTSFANVPWHVSCQAKRGGRSRAHQRRRHERVSGSKHLDPVARSRRCKNAGASVQERRDVLQGAAWSAQSAAFSQRARTCCVASSSATCWACIALLCADTRCTRFQQDDSAGKQAAYAQKSYDTTPSSDAHWRCLYRGLTYRSNGWAENAVRPRRRQART